jgi:large subunit ribosomal protein L19
VDLIKQIEKSYLRDAAKTEFSAGDTVTVSYRIQEGGKTRIQKYTGVVIQRRNGKGMNATFTVRKASANGVFVERIFALNSPLIEAINVDTKGRVRRARIYYLRQRTGKSARIRELKMHDSDTEESVVSTTPAAEVVAAKSAVPETSANDTDTATTETAKKVKTEKTPAPAAE